MLAFHNSLGFVVSALLVLPGAAFAQPSSTGQPPDTLQQLLTEVRQLRQTVDRAARDTATLQLVTIRAAMQEERLYRLTRDVDALRTRLLAASLETQDAAQSLKQFEAEVADEVDSGRRQSLQAELPAVRLRVQERRQIEQQLQLQESAMTDSLTAEEGRWQAINARLDEFERRLATPPR
ncbi:MAG TPA: hypothetical protein VMF13_17365 [Luteitalea sp.]|nr:hypothetical protein [Luteitalea sp.]